MKISLKGQVSPFCMRITYSSTENYDAADGDLALYASVKHPEPSYKQFEIKKRKPTQFNYYKPLDLEKVDSNIFSDPFLYVGFESESGIKITIKSWFGLSETLEKVGIA